VLHVRIGTGRVAQVALVRMAADIHERVHGLGSRESGTRGQASVLLPLLFILGGVLRVAVAVLRLLVQGSVTTQRLLVQRGHTHA